MAGFFMSFGTSEYHAVSVSFGGKLWCVHFESRRLPRESDFEESFSRISICFN